MKNNPFKFGSIVEDQYFTDRTNEIERVNSIIGSQNHLIIISPRRFGKSSLIMKVTGQLDRPVIAIDMQLITSTTDLAAQILKRIYRIFPFEKVRQLVQHFRIIPTITLNPVTNQVEVAFLPDSSHLPLLEDVLNLMEKLSTERKKLLVIFDEFQEIRRINADLMRQLRSIMQQHKLINYVFLGSQESLIKEIFEKKKSPFYHFGMILQLGKIPEADFIDYLEKRLMPVHENAANLAQQIISYTSCHPYYTQQLAFVVWDKCNQDSLTSNPVRDAVMDLIAMHDMDYERWWMALNKTDKKLMIGLSYSGFAPLSEAFYRKYDIGASSTAFSSIKRLMENGYINKVDNKYEMDDPFFSQWLKQRREA
ncbi:MAG: AAA family ATPase [Bacteroidales bacterium]|nr:AAA family ATPase [Bacteroidales bacterium]